MSFSAFNQEAYNKYIELKNTTLNILSKIGNTELSSSNIPGYTPEPDVSNGEGPPTPVTVTGNQRRVQWNGWFMTLEANLNASAALNRKVIHRNFLLVSYGYAAQHAQKGTTPVLLQNINPFDLNGFITSLNNANDYFFAKLSSAQVLSVAGVGAFIEDGLLEKVSQAKVQAYEVALCESLREAMSDEMVSAAANDIYSRNSDFFQNTLGLKV